MAVFDGVCYSLSSSLSPTRRSELAAVLDLNGAAPHPPYTHLIALPASHAYNSATNDPNVKLVTDRWVDRSVVMGKRQPEQYYSPDPTMIFSGVVACATDLSVADLEVLSAGVTALGGQWRVGLTRDVTHLFALRTGSDKYNTAVHFAPQTHMCILTPHWFDDAVRLGRRIPEAPYTWPDPLVLRPGITLNLHDGPLATEGGGQKRKPVGDKEVEDGANTRNEGEQVRIWAGRRILLSTSLGLADGSRGAIEARVQRAGGVVVSMTEGADEDEEERAVDESDVLITRWRSGKAYFKAVRASLLIGTLSWLFSVESSGTLHSPLDSLLWYPTPRGGIPDLIDCEISVTNYTGAARDYLKRLIALIGAKFTPSMSQSSKILVAGFQPSPKTVRALSWSIPVVNHTWLEDCLVEWRALTVGLERYIMYPPGIDFGKILMTRHDGPPASQTVSTLRLSGGAVPGGRGIGVVDVEQEELRDAGYRARTRKDSRARGPLQAATVTRTSSSSTRPKRGSISTPIVAPATGAFVDHVIELPADDEEVVSGKQRTPIDRKQCAPASSLGSRAGSWSVLKPPSVGPSPTSREDLGGDCEDVEEKRKGKEKVESGAQDTGKQQAHPAQEADGDEDTSHPVQRPRTRLVRHGSDVQAARQAPRSSKARRRAEGLAVGSDSDPRSDAGAGLEGSLPPRTATRAVSKTPVKSGMKPRPRSQSRSRPGSVLGGESGDEVRVVADEWTGANKRRAVAKLTRNSEVVTKEKDTDPTKEGRRGTEKVTSRPQSPTSSPFPTSSNTKNPRPRKRRLSVLVPPVPKGYFSSQSVDNVTGAEGERDQQREGETKGVGASTSLGLRHKQLVPAASMCLVAAEVSTSTSKRGGPSPTKVLTEVTPPRTSKLLPKTMGKLKPGASKEVAKTPADDDNMGTSEEVDDTSMIVDTPVTSTGRSGLKRGAANKATMRLREEIMPDVVSFEKEQKQAKRRRSVGWDSVTSVGRESEKVERSGKRRKVATRGDEEEEEAEVEDTVLVHSAKSKSKPLDEKSKARGSTTVYSNKGTDDPPVKNKQSGTQEKKAVRGRGKELTAIRLMTTGVVISDDVVKRLTKLGVQMTTKPTDCTHLVAKGIVRTEKFLCAMSVSPYVLTEEWANASAKSGRLLSENDFSLTDTTAEQKWEFRLADAMARAKGSKGGSSLFKQMTFYVTPKVSVDTKLLKNVVSAGGGQIQTSTTPTARILKGKANRYIISCPEDKAIWHPVVQEGFRVYSPELVLRGALRQEIEWEKEECLVAR